MIARTILFLLVAALAACRQSPLPTAGPGDPPVVPEIAGAAREGRPVIFVGLDGADWATVRSLSLVKKLKESWATVSRFAIVLAHSLVRGEGRTHD